MRQIHKSEAMASLERLVGRLRRGQTVKTGDIPRLELDFTELELEFQKKGLCLLGNIDRK